jgi:hypothetical protein
MEAMKIPSHIALFAVVVVAAIAAGCGGSSASSSGPSSVLPHDQLIAAADRICGAYSHTASVEFRNVTTNDEAAKVWTTYIGQFDQLIRDLRALRPSSQDAAAYAAWLDAGEKQRPLIVAAEPPSSDEATGKLVLVGATVNAMAAELGMRDCSVDVDLSEHPANLQRYDQLADGICANAAAAYGTVPEPNNLAGFDAWITTLTPLFQGTERDLDAIPAPPGDEDRVAAWRSAHKRSLDDIRKIQLAAQQGDMAGFEHASQVTQRDSDHANSLAADLGMTACAN